MGEPRQQYPCGSHGPCVLLTTRPISHRDGLGIWLLEKTWIAGQAVKSDWRVSNPPGVNPLVAERECTGVARCAEEMTGVCRDFQ